MIRRWLIALAGLLVAVGGLWAMLPEAPARISEGDAALDFRLPNLQGRMHGLPKGEVVLLNFWATWCPPCREEMPSMAELYRKYAARGLRVLAVSVDRRDADLAGFVKEYGLPFEVLHDADNAVSRRYGVFKFPETFLIGRDGRI
ncbi:MAG: TlpA disulfide reductase family protein, partial [Mariprofundaceae bacterium]